MIKVEVVNTDVTVNIAATVNIAIAMTVNIAVIIRKLKNAGSNNTETDRCLNIKIPRMGDFYCLPGMHLTKTLPISYIA